MGSVPLVTAVGDSRNLITFAAFGAAALLAYKGIGDLEQQRHIPLVLGVFLMILPFLPASNLFITVGFVVAERVLYIPSAGSVLVVVYGVQLVWWKSGTSNSTNTAGRFFLTGGVILLVICGAARTVSRNKDWLSRESLLRSGLGTLPHNAKMHYNFANFLRDSNRREDAILHYNEALRLWPSYASAHNNLGTLVVGSGHAEHHFLEAIRFSKDHVNAHYNLGKLYRKDNRSAESLAMLGRCVWLEPRFVPAWLEIAKLTTLSDRGPLLRKIIFLQPNNWEHFVRYAQWLETRELPGKALKMYIQAMRVSDRMPHIASIDLETVKYYKRGALQAVRGACLLLRTRGQRSRILQLVTRWHLREKRGAIGARDVYLSTWARRRELADRAEQYLIRSSPVSRTTCLDPAALDQTAPSRNQNYYYPDTHVRDKVFHNSNLFRNDSTGAAEKSACNRTLEHTLNGHLVKVSNCSKSLTIDTSSDRATSHKHNRSRNVKVIRKKCCQLNSPKVVTKVCKKTKCKIKDNDKKDYGSESVSSWLAQHIIDTL